MNEALRPFTKDRTHLDFRIATAVWGTLLAAVLLISSAASWIEARDQPGPFGEGAHIGRSVWALAKIPGYDESDPRRWWARLALVCLVVAAVVAAAAAASGSASLARAASVAGGCTVVATAIVWLVTRGDTYFRPAGGLYVALTVAVILTVWGLLVAQAAGEHDAWPDAG
jgi:hypothetical protein